MWYISDWNKGNDKIRVFNIKFNMIKAKFH